MVNIKRNLVVLFTLTICFVSNANAGFLVEPYVGFALAGKLDQAETPLPTTGTYSGLNFGGRVGYDMLGFMGGVTYNMAMTHTLDTVEGGVSQSDDVSRTDLGVFVGFEFPILVRVWASYYLDSKLVGEELSGADATTDFITSVKTVKGNGLGFGAGFTGLPFLSINLEYKTFTFDKIDTTGLVPTTDVAITPDLKTTEILLSVSLPFSF